MIPSILRGGTEIQTLNLIRVLRLLDIKVSILCYFEYDLGMVKDYLVTGTEVKLMKLRREINPVRLIFKLYQQIRITNPAYVHVQYMTPGALPIIAARIAGIKKVFATVHQPYTSSHGQLARIILRTSAILASRFITVSQNAELSWFSRSTLFNEIIPMANQPYHFTIHNSVDSVKIEDIISLTEVRKTKDDLKIALDKLVIGTVSRLRNEKGIDILIVAFAELLNRNNKLHLLIVGDGPDREKLMNQSIGLGLADSVTFLGSVDWEHAIKYIGIMDIVVVPSRFEGFGLTAAEAMAAGKPVVASDTFGLSEVVANEETGLLFAPEDSEILVKHLVRLCESETLREEFGINGKKRCVTHFGFDLFRRRIAALYSQSSPS